MSGTAGTTEVNGATPVREAVPGDVPALLELAHVMHGEGAYSDIAFDEDKLGRVLADRIARPDWLVLVAREPAGWLLGTLHAFVGAYFFGPERICSEQGFYVYPSCREMGIGAALLSRYEEWARQQGAREATLTTSMQIEPEAVAAFFESHGFGQVGTMHTRRFDP